MAADYMSFFPQGADLLWVQKALLVDLTGGDKEMPEPTMLP